MRIIPLTLLCLLMGGLLLLGGCANSNEEGGLREFFQADVERALGLARRTNDELAVRCYTYLLTRSPERSVLPTEKDGKFGAVTAFQVARTARRSVAGIRSSEYFEACGPMEMESRAAIRRGALKAILPF